MKIYVLAASVIVLEIMLYVWKCVKSPVIGAINAKQLNGGAFEYATAYSMSGNIVEWVINGAIICLVVVLLVEFFKSPKNK